MTWEVWEGYEVAGEPEKARVARRDKPSKKDLYLWKRLDEDYSNLFRKMNQKKICHLLYLL
jgi:hypothetical protein